MIDVAIAVSVVAGSVTAWYVGSLRFARWVCDRYDPPPPPPPPKPPPPLSFEERRTILIRQEMEWTTRGLQIENMFPKNYKEQLSYQRVEEQLTEIRDALAQIDKEEREQP